MMIPGVRRVGVAVVVLVLCGACSSGSSNGGASDSPGAILLGDLSGVEAEALEDKHISRGELDKANQVLAECVEAAGATFSLKENLTSYGASYESDSDDESDLISDELDICGEKVDAIHHVWIMQNQLPATERDAARSAYVECVSALLPSEIAADTSFEDAARIAKERSYKVDENIGIQLGDCSDQYISTIGSEPMRGLAEALAAL